jgi:E3 ubiquitin-protein ligase DOA10
MPELQANPALSDASKECAICQKKYRGNEHVVPLPCDVKHFFHTECIMKWIKIKNECPLCKKVITEKVLY